MSASEQRLGQDARRPSQFPRGIDDLAMVAPLGGESKAGKSKNRPRLPVSGYRGLFAGSFRVRRGAEAAAPAGRGRE